MKAGITKALAMTACLLVAGMATSASAEDASSTTVGMNHRFYIGLGAGQSSLKLSKESRNEEGIDFDFEGSDDNDLATSFIVGARASRNFGIEGGMINLGSVEQGFSFRDPRDGDTGTGSLEVSPGGIYVGTLLSHDIGQLQLYTRIGVLMWDYDMDLRFDVVEGDGAVSERRDFSKDGTSLFYGAGVRYKIAPNWSFAVDANFTDIDEDEFSVVGASIYFDVATWIERLDMY